MVGCFTLFIPNRQINMALSKINKDDWEDDDLPEIEEPLDPDIGEDSPVEDSELPLA